MDINNENPQNWKTLRIRSLRMGGLIDPQKHVPTCVILPRTMSFCIKGCIGINRGETPKLGSSVAPPPLDGVADSLERSVVPICATISNLVVLHKRMYAYIEGNP